VILGSLQRSKIFEQGGPLYGAQMSAQEMRERLKTTP
jgi:predicted dinucleotide-binding enzyme